MELERVRAVSSVVYLAVVTLLASATVKAQAPLVTDWREVVLANIAQRGDATHIEQHVPVLANYYTTVENESIWLTNGRVNDKARALVALFRSAVLDVLNPEDYRVGELTNLLTASTLAEAAHLEVSMSAALLDYVRHIAAGRVEPRRINPELAIDPVAPEPLSVLRGAAAATDIATYARAGFEPQTARYARLRGALEHYRKLTASGGWPTVPDGEIMKEGSTSAERVAALRTRLEIAGDLGEGAHSGDTYDGLLVAAVMAFQARHGLEVDGIIGANTLTEINTTSAARVRQIELNMERRRWMEDDLGDFYVFVNLADQFLKVVERRDDMERTIHTARTVVGKTYHRTPVFSETMKYIVVNPSWNVPRSIAVDEFLPKLKDDPGVLAEDNIRLVAFGRDVDPYSVDWSDVSKRSFAWQLQQRPGQGNALGRVKFMFPNRFNVYIHDTPAKSLFAKAQRIFSHGCVRVEHPFDLAQVLLGRQGMTRETIDSIKDRGVERVVSLKSPIPVHVNYLTAWVNKDGTVHFRRDVYGRDAILDSALRNAAGRAI